MIISRGAVAAEKRTAKLWTSDARGVTQNSEIDYTFKNLTEEIETSGDSFDCR